MGTGSTVYTWLGSARTRTHTRRHTLRRRVDWWANWRRQWSRFDWWWVISRKLQSARHVYDGNPTHFANHFATTRHSFDCKIKFHKFENSKLAAIIFLIFNWASPVVDEWKGHSHINIMPVACQPASQPAARSAPVTITGIFNMSRPWLAIEQIERN